MIDNLTNIGYHYPIGGLVVVKKRKQVIKSKPRVVEPTDVGSNIDLKG